MKCPRCNGTGSDTSKFPIAGCGLCEGDGNIQYEGYHSLDSLPIKRGDYVLIPKGVIIKSTHPQRGPSYDNPRGRKVCIHHLLPGSTAGILPVTNPTVVWTGHGGYWFSCDINDVEKVEAP